ncbi:MAG: hypothetical protein GY769_03600 [bacterium]|nr:hypothetical protein [bacterium]
MTETKNDVPRVIPEHMNPPVASEVVEVDGTPYLQTNEAMFTFYKRTKGEFSGYFLALRDEARIHGVKCPSCGTVRVPPFALMCPDCEFAEMNPVEMPDHGVMNSTPPITYFAHSLFQSWVPFGRGRVTLEGADTALPIHVYTTRGVLTPFIFKKGTPVKIVFRDERQGKPTDIFAVPSAELTPEQQAKSPLLESDLDFSEPLEPEVGEPADEDRNAFARAVEMLKELASGVEASPRARHNLAGWRRAIEVKTAAGSITLKIDDGRLEVVEEETGAEADFVMLCSEPKLLVDWMSFKEALTNAIITGKLWISVNREFTTIFKLDRLPRSVRRDAQSGG